MKLENISEGKIIGIGDVTVLPGEVKDIPQEHETNPILEVYRKCGLVRLIGKAAAKTDGEMAAKKEIAGKKDAGEAETLRQARLKALDGLGEEELGALANELGINPAECRDQADVLKKVRAALKKQ